MEIKIIKEDMVIEVINMETMEEETLELNKNDMIHITKNDITEYFIEFKYNNKMYQTSSYTIG